MSINLKMPDITELKPRITVLVVTSVCQATLPGFALVSFQIADGAGMM